MTPQSQRPAVDPDPGSTAIAKSWASRDEVKVQQYRKLAQIAEESEAEADLACT